MQKRKSAKTRMRLPSLFTRIAFRTSQLVLLLLLPFILLLRGGIWLHSAYGVSPWVAMGGGFALSGTLLFLYVLYLQRRMWGRIPAWKVMRWQYALVAALVLVYCFPALFTLSLSNAKSPQVREEFRSLHPVLRLGVSTLIWMEPELVLTDAQRIPEDYAGMGLPARSRSLHYTQADGYAHAVDIRTLGKASWRNKLVRIFFEAMGFDCLRHVGTADHLHVSLPPGPVRG